MNVKTRMLLMMALAALACGGRAEDHRDSSGDGGSATTDAGGSKGIGGSGTGGDSSELPSDCPSWESGAVQCETCGGEYVERWGRFPSELGDHLLPGDYSGICPPPELVDFEAFNVELPEYEREVHLVEWDPENIECFYFVASDDSDARACEDHK